MLEWHTDLEGQFMTHDEAFDARKSVEDRGALAVGTKLYFAELGSIWDKGGRDDARQRLGR